MGSMTTTRDQEGWAFPALAKKAHYFVNVESLCGRWWFTGQLDENQKTPEKPQKTDCVECHRKAVKRGQP
jgi:hypothetical protein